MLVVGARPSEVKHKLALRVRFDVDGAGSDQLALTLQQKKARRPAGGGGGAAVGMHGAQKGVAHEGRGRTLGEQEAVPGGGIDLEGRVQHPNDIIFCR